MKTRRKSKVAAAAAAEADQDHDAASVQTEDAAGPSKHDLALALPDDLDTEYLASLLPETNLSSPNPDAIISMYRLLVSQDVDLDATRRAVEEAQATLEKKDIELDQALQDRESSTQEVEKELASTQQELVEVKREREELREANQSMSTQISSLSTSNSSSTTELDTLKQKVSDTEREKRELLGVVSRLKEDGAQREAEIKTLRDDLRQARQEHQTLEAQLRELRSTETSTRFKVDSLTQQLQLARDEANRATSELTIKSEDFAKYRHTKHTELTQLQAAHDALAQEHASIEARFKSLQSAHSSQTQQLTQAQGRIQDLTGRLAEKDATFANEAAGLKRLVAMMEERETQAKALVENIEKEWADVGERAESREAALREELEKEKRRVEESERRVEEMERVLERVNRGDFPVPAPGTAPSTPARGGTPDLMTQGMLGLSPTVAIASRVQKSGKTFTEVYADHVRLQDEYAKKSAEYDRMERTLSQVLAQIEERAPILAHQRAEYERLQSEATQLASQLADALADRDSNASAAQDFSQKLNKTTRENDLLQKQLNDLGRQIQTLLKELARAQDPMIPSDEDLEADGSIQPAENIDEVITNQLVVFRSIGGLQERNQQLLQLVRKLGDKMESEEKEYREALEKEQSEAVQEAHEAITTLEAQLRSQKEAYEVKIQAYMKERDSLKTLLARAERTGGGSAASATNGRVNVVNGTAPQDSDIAQELAEIQSQFDAYRTEMGIDSGRLREQNESAQREVAHLNAALAKAMAKVEFLTERQKMSQEQFQSQAREIDGLQQRNQQLYDQWTRVDIECNRVTEDFVACKGRLEQMRTECANLRAEKGIWESIQSRLVEENKQLSMERSHLSDLMSNVQKMHNDLERSGENDRRRLESQIQMLENQSQDLRKQLNDERDNIRRVTLQREVEAKEMRATIDKHVESLSTTREALVKAETSKNHLEERVEALSRQLQGNEEKLAVYERRGTTVGVTHAVGNDDMSKEQQLEAEVAELRSTLKVAQLDLSNARNNVQQFQEISQANEAALSTLNSTYDEYKRTTEAQLAQLDSDNDALQANLKRVEEELTKSKEALTEAQRSFEVEREAWLNDKKTLEDTIVDLTTSEKAFAEDRSSRETAVQQQEERVKAAEERYTREVVAHAESIKAIEELKQQINGLQTSARTNLAAAETAQAKLVSSESSWSQQRATLDKELADVTARCKELAEQNKVLHQHLETVSTQAAKIRQAADASTDAGGDGQPTDEADTKLSELRAVIGYLRREKDIVEMQLELSKQESTRLKTQITHLTHDLDETRTTLSEERERAVAAATTDAQHAELLDKISQLTLLRESNATLRADSEANAKRARELDAQVKNLTTELEPLRGQVRNLQAELQSTSTHVKRLEDESRRWQERNAQLLSKYDRIDPSEVQTLKDEMQRLATEKAALEAANATHEQELKVKSERVEAVEKALGQWKERNAQQIANFRQRMGAFNSEKSQLNANLHEAQTQLKAVQAERDALKASSTAAAPDNSAQVTAELAKVRADLEQLRAERDQLAKALEEEKARKPETSGETVPAVDTAELDARIASLTQERDALLAEKASWSASATTSTGVPSEDAKREFETKITELEKSRDTAVFEAKSLKEQMDKLSSDVRGLRQQNETFKSRLTQEMAARQKLVTTHKAELEAAAEKATANLENGQPNAGTEALVKQHAEELRAMEKKYIEELKAAAEKAPADASASEDQAAAIERALAEKTAELKKRHEEEITKAMENGRLEGQMKMKIKDAQLVKVQRKVKDLEAQIHEWRTAGLLPAEETTASAAGVSNSPATPSSSAPAPAATASVPPTPTNGSAPPAAGRGAPRGGAPGNALPRKPSVAGTAQAAAPHPAPQPGRGRGRGVAIGRGAGMSIRGTAAAAGAGAPAGGVSIIGAAGKRARESETGGESSLAKRLKPAEGVAAGKPVAIQRNRQQQQPPPS